MGGRQPSPGPVGAEFATTVAHAGATVAIVYRVLAPAELARLRAAHGPGMSAAFVRELLLAALVRWDLEAADGTPVALTRARIAGLRLDLVAALLDALFDDLRRRAAPPGEDHAGGARGEGRDEAP